MPSLARLLVMSAVLLGLFLAAVLVAQGWLRRQDDRLRAEAITTRRAQFQQAAALLPASPATWTERQRAQLAGAIDAEVTVLAPGSVAPETPAGNLGFVAELAAAGTVAPTRVAVSFALPPLLRLPLIHFRTWAFLLVLALAIMLLFIALGTLWPRQIASTAGDSRTPWRVTKGEMGSLEQLAKVSAAQSTALAEARDVQQRTEQDLLLNQRLLNQSLEEKIRLGRDLHDGLIQSLYAAGLTLESIRPLITEKPAEADRRLEQCLTQLNAAIRDVRNYITGLAPNELRRLSFGAAIELFIRELRAGRDVEFRPTIDEDAAAALPADRTLEVLQIAREAISNSLRHGGATSLSVRLHRSGDEVGLLIQDNGTGFDAERRAGTGHGLGNMHARAAHLGAVLRIDSRPGDGTRVVLTIPVA
jgi:signal transduction histidine kinase